MSNFISVLQLRATTSRAEAIQQFISAGVIEACRDTIPGFVKGTLLEALDDDRCACVIVEWQDRESFEQWMHSPVREALGEHSGFTAPGRSMLFGHVHDVHR